MRELIGTAEIMDYELAKFIHLAIVWRENDNLYTTQPSRGKIVLDNLDSSANNCKLIPPEHIHGTWRHGLKEAADDLPLGSYYIKTPCLLEYEGGNDIGRAVTAEVEIMEILMKNPHPNICKYLGCRLDGPFITGIYLQRYKSTLLDRFKAGIVHDQQTHILDGIRAGIEFLHSLGLVHDDINPSNIMFDDDDNRPVVIDFDSCSKVGSRAVKGGTPGWCNESTTASFKNDYYSLNLIERWMKGHYTPHKDELPPSEQ